MFDPSSLLSSKAKWAVLRTLFYQPSPLPLRHVAALSGVPLFSVQRALRELTDKQVILKKRKGQYTLFLLNADHVSFSFLAQLFELETKSRIAFSSDDYHRRAKGVLDFSRSAKNLLRGRASWT